MLPKVEQFDVLESLPRAMAALMNVKRELTARSESAAKRLGVAPPGWVSTQAIKDAFKEGRMTQKAAEDALIQFHRDELPAPDQYGPPLPPGQ